jgi:hypothetical protein
MHATLPVKLELHEPSDQELGMLIAHVCGQMLNPSAPNTATLLRQMSRGDQTMVFNANNEFVFG